MFMQSELKKALVPGDTLDHYRLEQTVTQSSMSTLYRAVDLNSGRRGGAEGAAP